MHLYHLYLLLSAEIVNYKIIKFNDHKNVFNQIVDFNLL